MHRCTHALLITFFSILALTSGHSAGAVANPAADQPRSAAKTLAPFVDARTVLVARIDLAQADVAAAFKVVQHAVASATTAPAPPLTTPVATLPATLPTTAPSGEDIRLVLADLAAAKLAAEALKDQLTAAGVKEVYVLLSLSDMFPASDAAVGFIWIFPSAQPEKAQAVMQGWFDRYGYRLGIGKAQMKCETVHGAAVLAAPSAIARLKKLESATRPSQADLATAFQAAGAGAVQILLIPTPDMRRVVEELLPTLPEKVGGIPSKTLTRGVLWAGLGLSLAPKMQLTLTIQSEDAATAKALAQYLPTPLELMQQLDDGLDATRLPPAMGALQPVPQPAPFPFYKALARSIKPTVAGDRVLVQWDQGALDEFLDKVLVPTLAIGREEEELYARQAHVQGIMTTLLIWKDIQSLPGWPDSLQQAVGEKGLAPEQLKAEHPGKPGFTYRKPDESQKGYDMTKTVVIYEAFDTWPGPIAVGFADGQVKMVPTEAQFKALLAGTKPK